MKAIMMIALGLVLVGSSTAAFAKKHTTHTAQAHHCQLKGAEVSKSKAACKKAGGTWEAGAPTAKAAAPADAEPMK
jgi:hypothetical protein